MSNMKELHIRFNDIMDRMRIFHTYSSLQGPDQAHHINVLRHLLTAELTEQFEREMFFTDVFLPCIVDGEYWTLDDLRVVRDILGINKNIKFTLV